MNKSSSVLLAYLALSVATAAQVIVSHTGNSDPAASESFASISSGSGNSAGPVIDDGVNAWSVASSSGSSLYYQATPSAQQWQDALNSGWELSATVRLISGGAPAAQGFSFDDGAIAWQVLIYPDSSGDPIVELPSSGLPSLTLLGAGGGYHNYAVRYNPVSGEHSFWFDNSQIVIDFTGGAWTADHDVKWGTLRTTGSQANWNSLSLTAVPEPQGCSLVFGVALLGFSAWWSRSQSAKRARRQSD